ncbi:MAG: spermidine/putrescine ABC transporter substrate-binding protein [Candidatus Adiutrix sp.]|jgi:spermidine/putrescine transport system substrate-binding protein|nr:spermidine/putrescine ABC transporter substrate-binding protein [Candidatus Adiutrix sp.]
MKNLLALAALLLVFGPAAPASAAGTLNVFIWSEYMDPEVISDFEKRFDVDVREDNYESNEEMVIKLDKGGGLGKYDIIVPSTYVMPSLTNLKLIQELDHARLPNLGNLDPQFAALAADPGHRYSIPYQWGTSGLAVRSADPGQIWKSWGLVFDPNAKGSRFVLFDTARDCLGSALKYLGYSFNSTNSKEIEEAVRLLTATTKRPALLSFDGGVGGLNKVLSGIATVAQVYSGEALKSHDEEDQDVHYIIPEEGCEIWTDLVAIPQRAPNLENAYLFMNYLLDAKVGAKLAISTRYATPNAAARAFIPQEYLDNPAMYPRGPILEKMEYINDLGSANRLYDEAWTMIKTQ